MSSAYESDWKLAVIDFAANILHGDKEHQEWLLDAAQAFINGEIIPPVRPK